MKITLEIETADYESVLDAYKAVSSLIEPIDQDECEHGSVNCPGDIKTIRCDECGKSMYSHPSQIEELTNEYTETPYDLVLVDKLNEVIRKLNSLKE